MLAVMLRRGWLDRVPEQRAVSLTVTGSDALREVLGIEPPAR